jgi:hypothetical protein
MSIEKDRPVIDTTRKSNTFRWWLGLMVSSVFSMIYFITPLYILTALFALLRYPCERAVWLYVCPICVSSMLKPIKLRWILKLFRPMLDYFDYEEIVESYPVDVRKEVLENGKNYLTVFHPHGALSYTAIVSTLNAPPELLGKRNACMSVWRDRL